MKDFIVYYLKQNLNIIAQRSYVHENGFYKIVLDKSSTHQLRLHIWNGDFKNDENIHNHRFHFVSELLIGKYKEEIYQKSEYGEEFYTYNYDPSNELSYSLKKIDNIKICKEKTLEHSQGDTISRNASMFHRVIPMTSEVVSLFLTTGNLSNNCMVLNEKPINQFIEARTMTDSEILYLVKNYLKIEL